MAGKTTKISVTAVDNEIYLIASQPSGSSELIHLKSGYHAPVNYSFNPSHILASGDYDLTMVGLNWGGPGTFSVTVTTDGNDETYSASNSDVGVIFHTTVAISV